MFSTVLYSGCPSRPELQNSPMFPWRLDANSTVGAPALGALDEVWLREFGFKIPSLQWVPRLWVP